jgi:hypothetical protein
MRDCSSASLTMRSKSGLWGTDGGMLATTQPATPAKHGTTDANSIARMATERAASRDAPRPTGARTPREPCTGCGCTDWLEGRFSMGRLWCITCWEGSQHPAAAMPPNTNERRQLSLWIAGQASRGAPR